MENSLDYGGLSSCGSDILSGGFSFPVTLWIFEIELEFIFQL